MEAVNTNKTKQGILSAVGHTPLVHLRQIYDHLPVELHAKLEMFNPGGSIKDRPAYKMMARAIEKGQLQAGATVVESSSGNMAIGLAQVCKYFGLSLIIVVDPKINSHTLNILQTYGARIEKVREPDDYGNYLAARLQRVQQLVKETPNAYWPNQYANTENSAAHYQTMEEIVKALPRPPDYLLASTSTCGTIMGCAAYVRDHELKTRIMAIDAVGSVIFGGPAADRLVPGHGAGRPSDLLDKKVIDQVIRITDKECIIGCRRLLNREAILAGGSSGAVIMAVEKLQSEIPSGSTCALILADSGERYLDTIYSDEWIEKHFGEIETSESPVENKPQIGLKRSSSGDRVQPATSNISIKNGKSPNVQTPKIAIIGGGPKGMYGFERLAAQFTAHRPQHNVEVHIYNKSSHFGAGANYHPGQPDYLLINNPSGDINMWIDEQPVPAAKETLSLTEWLQKKKSMDVTANDYVSRALVGQYLKNGFEIIASLLPQKVRGEYIAGEVVDIRKENERYTLQVVIPSGQTQEMPHRYDHLLLATGHPIKKMTEKEKEFQKFTGQTKGVGYVPFVYPVDTSLKNIMPGSRVGMKGIGLTFVDAVLALTEGRGGIFERGEQNLRYRPAGNEPQKIYPFSRSGLPMIPRGPAPKNTVPLKFFTESSLEALKGETKSGKLNFKTGILPLLKQEMQYAFYEVALRQEGFSSDLQSCTTFAEVRHHINQFHKENSEAARFDVDVFLEPLRNSHFQNADSFHEQVKDYLKFFIGEARRGERQSRWAAVSAVWRKATPLFGSFYAFGGLTAGSQCFFDTRFRRLLNRVTFGPPIKSVEKLVALMDAGILDFGRAQNPSIEMDKDKRKFNLCSKADNQPVEYLTDARIPKVSIFDNQATLYRNMLCRGLVSMFCNKEGQDTYKPGCINISPHGFVIDQKGNRNTSIAVTGTPTEGVTFDNDALARGRNNFVSGWTATIRQLYTQPEINHHAS